MSRLKTIYTTSFSFIRFFLSTSTIHGLNHIAERKRHFLERLLWFVLVVISSYWIANLSSQALVRYIENPTVISMERDYFSWNTTFPAITICPTNKLSPVALEAYVDGSSAKNKTDLRLFLESLAEAGYDSFDSVMLYDGIAPEEYMEVLLKLQEVFRPPMSCPDIKNVNCVLQKTVTEMGICYSFNSQLAVYNSPEYRGHASWKLIKQEEPLAVNPLDGDIFVNVVNISSGYNVSSNENFRVQMSKLFKLLRTLC